MKSLELYSHFFAALKEISSCIMIQSMLFNSFAIALTYFLIPHIYSKYVLFAIIQSVVTSISLMDAVGDGIDRNP